MEHHRSWVQQQLASLLSWDATVVESIADALVNATDEKHVASIFKEFMPSTPAIAAFQQQFLARAAKGAGGSTIPLQTKQPPPTTTRNTKKAAPERAGTSVTIRSAPSSTKSKTPQDRKKSPGAQGPAGLASQLDKRIVNCLGCGKIFHCTHPLGADVAKFLEAGGICTFCSRPVALYVNGQRVQPPASASSGGAARDASVPGAVGAAVGGAAIDGAAIDGAAVGGVHSSGAGGDGNVGGDRTVDAREAAALALKERLVEYDRNSAQRTSVIDDQSDYYEIESNAWLTDEERSTLKAQQEAVERAAEERKNRIVVTFDLLGRQVLVQDATDVASSSAAAAATPSPLQAHRGATTMYAPTGNTSAMTSGDAQQELNASTASGVHAGPSYAEEGPLRAVRNPAAHVVPVFIAQP